MISHHPHAFLLIIFVVIYDRNHRNKTSTTYIINGIGASKITMKNAKRAKRTMWAVRTGLIVNIFLALLKTSVGIIGHSPALLADGINSTSDVAYYLVVAVFMRLAGKPPDYEHPYGHRQLESIAALVVGSFVMATAVAIFWNAMDSIFDLIAGVSNFQGSASLALWVALFTIAIKIIITRYTQKIGNETGNPAVTALAYDHRNDILAAIAAAVGISLGLAGYLWVDPLAGAIVSLFVLRTGVEILRESSNDLMDTIPGKSLGKQVTNLLQPISGVQQIEEIHAHRFGPYLVINVTIGVDGSISVAKGDAIACQVEECLYQNIKLLRRVYVHYHPIQQALQQTVPILTCQSAKKNKPQDPISTA